ncbi:MAG TPA: bifunctional alpha,alpha-trehalose-phosphate synthase (UDP-forming)/trehalose-phosphatase [Myxococcota bacterium]|nr:bifunctional alpha,alpha-trehalose-phosphate synthase (UDP-forming)/trehalose-phosphatase [Myxococcota bacterium]
MTARSSHGRLVVVSNRLPVISAPASEGGHWKRAPGGLVSALDPALRSRGGRWVGWPGGRLRNAASLNEYAREAGYQLTPVQLSAREVRRFYLGFANGTLWPLLHSFPARVELDQEDWLAYELVNRRFASAIANVAASGDLVWIHDYQLTRVAPHLRRADPSLRIAFFLHVPFPHFDLFRILPWDREVLAGLLACDLIGFHCAGYAANFLDCAERLLGARVDRAAGKIEHGERTVTVGVYPLGIDFARFAELAEQAPERAANEPRLVLGVDRLDYTKGLPQKLLAFERLLELHPEHRERVVLLQIAEPSRDELPEYQRVKRQVDELVGRVNGRFTTSRWTPVRYLRRSVPPQELSGLYRDADVALVAPLRDGMNLVAKEYVACQTREPGVLILSRLAGAAETMQEAIHVNPYDIDGVARALDEALTMDLAERTERMRALQQRERRHDVHGWVARFLEKANAPVAGMRPFQLQDFAAWLGGAAEGQRLALFLDFDGTLAEIVSHPTEARMSESMRSALAACASRKDTDICVVSGRALSDVTSLIDVPGVILVGNHGLEIAGGLLAPFSHPDLPLFAARLRELAKELEAVCPPGSWVEDKAASLTVHFRDSEPASQPEIAQRVKDIARDAGFQVRDALCAVEVRPPTDWDKGDAVLHVLRSLHGRAWSESVEAVYVGDDETDEDAFRALQGLGVTFRVGRAERPTLANHRLPNLGAVETLLTWIAGR